MPTAGEYLALGRARQVAGQLADAARFYEQAIAADPTLAAAHNLLGAALGEQGQLDQAIEHFQHARHLDPNSAEIADNLRHAVAYRDNQRGKVLASQGRLAEAVVYFRQAIAVRPDFAEAHHNLATALAEQGELNAAVASHRRSLELRPNSAEAHNNLGVALMRLNQPAEASECLRHALELNPAYFKAHNNLGAALAKLHEFEQAEASCRRAVALRDDFVEGHNMLACVLRDQNKLEEAAASCRRSLELKPDDAEAHANLASILERLECADEAITEYRQALAVKPDFAEATMNLGILLSDRGEFEEALALWEQALEVKPDLADVHQNRGVMLMHQGRPREAQASFEAALHLDPQLASAHSCALLAAQYQTGVTPAALLAAHREFGCRHAVATPAPRHDNTREPERALRIGFVSPDFSRHPVGWFLVRVLENLDRRQCLTTCYCDRHKEDGMTARLRAAASGWRNVVALNDRQLIEQIRADRIDVLFDLAGHTGTNRLPMFAHKPAPIQITWMGYVGTTGLEAMDYLLTDRYQTPEAAEAYSCERVLRMPDDYVCYEPPADAPDVSPLPALARGHVTFGCFNNPAKVTPEIISVWADILHRVPGSRLMLKYRWYDSAVVGERVSRLFAERGIDRQRLEFLGGTLHEDLLRQYQRLDIALDTFPYSGGLTTCEALWMGVPVVTCPGETFASRHSLSHLSTVGLTETIAETLEDYVRVAVALAEDLPRLAEMRRGLREQMAASPLCDGPRFATNLMHVLRTVWRTWCSEQCGKSS